MAKPNPENDTATDFLGYLMVGLMAIFILCGFIFNIVANGIWLIVLLGFGSGLAFTMTWILLIFAVADKKSLSATIWTGFVALASIMSVYIFLRIGSGYAEGTIIYQSLLSWIVGACVGTYISLYLQSNKEERNYHSKKQINNGRRPLRKGYQPNISDIDRNNPPGNE